jgi:predicted dehydrogenase
LALVGTGFIGSVHAKNAARHPGAELVAVYDANLEASKRIGDTTGAKGVADDFVQFLEFKSKNRGWGVRE